MHWTIFRRYAFTVTIGFIPGNSVAPGGLHISAQRFTSPYLHVAGVGAAGADGFVVVADGELFVGIIEDARVLVPRHGGRDRRRLHGDAIAEIAWLLGQE